MTQLPTTAKSKETQKCALTEALIADLHIPQVDTQIICRHVSLPVTVDRYRVDVIRVGIAEHASRRGGGHRVTLRQLRYLKLIERGTSVCARV